MTIEEIGEILHDCGATTSIVIRPEHRLKEELLLSSFSIMLLILRLEKALHCVINPSDFSSIEKVRDLLALIDRMDTLKKD
jgi:acyl carrier protein